VFCGQCGKSLPDDVRFCQSCGRPTASTPIPTIFTNVAAAVAPASSSFPAPGTASYQHRGGHIRKCLCGVGIVIFGLVLLRVVVTVLGIVVGLALHARSITLEVMNHFVPILAGNAIVGVLCYVLAAKSWKTIKGAK
jgi:hypothetical protein